MVVSSAVTLTLMTFAPAASATWWPAAVSASASAASDESRYSNVASASVVAGVTVTAAMPEAAAAV